MSKVKTSSLLELLGIMAFLLLVGFITLGVIGEAYGATVKPKTTEDLAKVTVKITDLSSMSGGSGVILQSKNDRSFILTNSHVCEVATNGGLIHTNKEKLMVNAMAHYKRHDLCLIRVLKDLGVNTLLAPKEPKIYSEAIISGHPALMPTIITKGHFSGYEIIDVFLGYRECTEEELEDVDCIMYGNKVKVKKFYSQVVSATIIPGSSGSAVYNSNGEISGVVFASKSRELAYAYIVPYAYVSDFIKNVKNGDFKIVDVKVKTGKEEQSRTATNLLWKNNDRLKPTPEINNQ